MSETSDSAPNPPRDPEKRAAYEAAVIVGAHFQLDPLRILGPGQTHAVASARRVVWYILHSAGWNNERISDVTAFTRQAVKLGVDAVESAKKGTALAKIRDACLAEAAGGGT